MKNTILKTIILFLLTIPFQSHAQKYRKMLGDSSVWYEVYVFEGAGTTLHLVYGDSTVGGIHYKMLFSEGNSNISAFLREDTLAQKIYLKRIDSSNLPEKVLYDFSKKVGDSINIGYVYGGLLRIEDMDTGYIVDSIKTRPILSDSLRYFYGHSLAHHKNAVQWIESVGNPSGLLKSIYNFDIWNFTSCKFSDGLHQYRLPKGNSPFDNWIDTSCYIYYSSLTQIENNNFSIYPNPFTNQLTIEGKPLQNCKAEVYDITGKLLETIIINGNGISFNNYYNGLVLIRIFDRRGNVVGVVKGVKL